MFFGFGYYMDAGLVLVLIAGIFSMIASMRVNSTFRKFSSMHTGRNITGEQAARRILDSNGLYDVSSKECAVSLPTITTPRQM